VRLIRSRSPIGTPASSGPYARLRVNDVTRYYEAYQAWLLIIIGRRSVRDAARIMGLSPTTAWRRANWFNDMDLNRFYGFPAGPPPRQRGTRAVPRGRPIVLPMDAQFVIDTLLADGFTLEDIVAAKRVIPACVRRIAARQARTATENHKEAP